MYSPLSEMHFYSISVKKDQKCCIENHYYYCIREKERKAECKIQVKNKINIDIKYEEEYYINRNVG